jgi:hypothetical protein
MPPMQRYNFQKLFHKKEKQGFPFYGTIGTEAQNVRNHFTPTSSGLFLYVNLWAQCGGTVP